MLKKLTMAKANFKRFICLKDQLCNFSVAVQMLIVCVFVASLHVTALLQEQGKPEILYRKQKYLNLNTKKLLVISLIQCHFDYTCSFWYPGLTQFLRNRLQNTQNKIIRLVLKWVPGLI